MIGFGRKSKTNVEGCASGLQYSIWILVKNLILRLLRLRLQPASFPTGLWLIQPSSLQTIGSWGMHWVMHGHFSAPGPCYCSLWRRIYSYLFESIFERAYLFVSIRIYTYLFVSIRIYFGCVSIFIDTRIYSYLFWGGSYLFVSIRIYFSKNRYCVSIFEC